MCDNGNWVFSSLTIQTYGKTETPPTPEPEPDPSPEPEPEPKPEPEPQPAEMKDLLVTVEEDINMFYVKGLDGAYAET